VNLHSDVPVPPMHDVGSHVSREAGAGSSAVVSRAASTRGSNEDCGMESGPATTTQPGQGDIPTEAVVPSTSTRPSTRAQHGIRRSKVYTDGTVQYDKHTLLAAIGEPSTVNEALGDKN
jgi:hypothetical protein